MRLLLWVLLPTRLAIWRTRWFRPDRNTSSAKRDSIIVFRLDALGDLVLTTPVFRELKRAYPSARITAVAQQAHRSILETNPHIDELLCVPSIGKSRRLRTRPLSSDRPAVLLARTSPPALRRCHLSPLGYRRASRDVAVQLDESNDAHRLTASGRLRASSASTEASIRHLISASMLVRCATKLSATSPSSKRSRATSTTPQLKSH